MSGPHPAPECTDASSYRLYIKIMCERTYPISLRMDYAYQAMLYEMRIHEQTTKSTDVIDLGRGRYLRGLIAYDPSKIISSRAKNRRPRLSS